MAGGIAAVRAAAPYDLVFANILARPLCLMARHLAHHLAPGGTAILSGLLATQARDVMAAHRRCGLRLETSIQEGRVDYACRPPPIAGGGDKAKTSVSDVVPTARMIRSERRLEHAAKSARDSPISDSSRSVIICISCSTAWR